MSNLVLVSQSNVSLPLFLPFLMATLSFQWVTPHLWLPPVCFCTLGIIHITHVHQKIQVLSHCSLKAVWSDSGICMQPFCQHVETNQINTRVHPGLISPVWISVSCPKEVSLMARSMILWMIPVSLIHYPNGIKSLINHRIVSIYQLYLTLKLYR